MEKENIKTIVTHEKNILSLKELKRIDPVLNPILVLEIGEKLDINEFNKRSI